MLPVSFKKKKNLDAQTPTTKGKNVPWSWNSDLGIGISVWKKVFTIEYEFPQPTCFGVLLI